MSALDQELLSFTNATRRLGAAAVLAECAGGIRRHLNDVESLFRTNLQPLNSMNARTRARAYNLVERLSNGLSGLAGELMHFKRVSAYSCDVP